MIAAGQAKLVYRHFAFLGIESFWAAQATECAGEQGKFWPYHDKLYSEQSSQNRNGYAKANLKRFAADLNLDTSAFNTCLDSNRYEPKVRTETEAGRRKGVQATPTLFVAGQKFEGAPPFNQLRQIVEAAARATPAR